MLKEQLLRATQAALGARYLMSLVVPGGTRLDLTDPCAPQLAVCAREIAREALTLRAIYDEHEGVRDRFNGAGTVVPQLAQQLGLTGLAGRASGQAFDLRVDMPCPPYARLEPTKCGGSAGDVAKHVHHEEGVGLLQDQPYLDCTIGRVVALCFYRELAAHAVKRDDQ